MSQSPETPQQRRERYLRLAAEATRDHYLRIAQAWRDLAAEIEQDE